MAIPLSRRGVLVMGGGAVVAVSVSACGGSASDAGGTVQPASPLVATEQVPMTSGVVIADPPVVVTQPESGNFKAFSAICPHQGCLVDQVVNNEIVCPCHGSRFSAVDGAVLVGPATEGLSPEVITVSDGSISLG